jgi:hypothetical protein
MLTGRTVRGVILAGPFHHESDRVFWDVHDPAKAVVIHLVDERCARLVVGSGAGGHPDRHPGGPSALATADMDTSQPKRPSVADLL